LEQRHDCGGGLRFEHPPHAQSLPRRFATQGIHGTNDGDISVYGRGIGSWSASAGNLRAQRLGLTKLSLQTLGLQRLNLQRRHFQRLKHSIREKPFCR
jgi:hypothetical protein